MAGLPGFKGNTLPVSPGTLHGLRAFELDVEEGTLRGVSFDEAWSGSENVASCRDEKNKGTRHSIKECAHGYWSYFGVSSEYMGDGRVSAVIEGYGEVVVGEKGFRSEKARVKAIAIPDIRKLMAHRAEEHKKEMKKAKAAQIETLIVALMLLFFPVSMIAAAVSSNSLPGVIIIIMVSLFSLITLLGAVAFAFIHVDTRKYYKELKKKEADAQNVGYVNWTLKQKEIEAKLQENYPDAILYPSLKDMVKAHSNDIILHGMLLT